MEKKKQIWKKWWFWVIVVIVVGAIGSGGNEKQTTNDNTVKEKVKEKALEVSNVKKELTIEEEIENAILTVGEKTNNDKPRIAELMINDTPDGSKIVAVTLNGDDNFTTGMMKTGMLMKTSKILEKMYEIDGVFQTSISWQLPLVDQYGNEKESDVLRIVINKEIAGKINWKNFINDNFKNIALEYFEHPALSK